MVGIIVHLGFSLFKKYMWPAGLGHFKAQKAEQPNPVGWKEQLGHLGVVLTQKGRQKEWATAVQRRPSSAARSSEIHANHLASYPLLVSLKHGQ
jgi:hypothetical protein